MSLKANQARVKGHPLQRAMFLEFPDDRTTHHLDRQYMLGPSLLVAPVFVPTEEESEYYLPAGRWTHFWSNRVLEGPVWIKEFVPLDEIPLWVREGTVIGLGPQGIGRPDYEYGKELRVFVYSLGEGQTAKVDVPGPVGGNTVATIHAERKEGKLTVEVEGACEVSSLKVFDKNIVAKSLSGGTKKAEGEGYVEVELEKGSTKVVFEL